MIKIHLGKPTSRRHIPLSCTATRDASVAVEITPEQLASYMEALTTVQAYQTRFRYLRRHNWMVRA